MIGHEILSRRVGQDFSVSKVRRGSKVTTDQEVNKVRRVRQDLREKRERRERQDTLENRDRTD